MIGIVIVEDETYIRKGMVVTTPWEQLGCKVYAFCLMTNHIHPIIDPGKDVKAVAQLMKRVNGK